MKKTILIVILSVFANSYVTAKNKVLILNPEKNLSANCGLYTNLVQDIAVYQEACQNNVSGHYTSKMYEFDFYHNDKGKCIATDSSSVISFKAILDDDATHVVKSMGGVYESNNDSVIGGSVICDLNMKKSDELGIYYVGTCTIEK